MSAFPAVACGIVVLALGLQVYNAQLRKEAEKLTSILEQGLRELDQEREALGKVSSARHTAYHEAADMQKRVMTAIDTAVKELSETPAVPKNQQDTNVEGVAGSGLEGVASLLQVTEGQVEDAEKRLERTLQRLHSTRKALEEYIDRMSMREDRMLHNYI
eukprot:Sspe_Gene.59769::Locus_32860_Transcript_1_1_Confidence_1.000_Length_709::g.59769::m.59769